MRGRSWAEVLSRVSKEGSDLLAKHGLGENVLADLEAAIVRLDQLTAIALEAKRSHVGATNELTKVKSDLSELLGVLDGIARYRFADAPQLLGAWSSARNVANPVRSKAAPPPAEGGVDKAT